MESEDDDSYDLQVAKPKRKWNGKMEWTLSDEAMSDWSESRDGARRY